MSDIAFVRNHALPIATTKALVQKAADALASEHGLESEWRGNTLRFQRSGVHGEIRVTDAKIHLEVTLGFLLKPFKAKFAGEIERSLDKYLPEPGRKVPAGKHVGKAVHTSR
jgi:putative polyhydroxyalkanoate system protein